MRGQQDEGGSRTQFPHYLFGCPLGIGGAGGRLLVEKADELI